MSKKGSTLSYMDFCGIFFCNTTPLQTLEWTYLSDDCPAVVIMQAFALTEEGAIQADDVCVSSHGGTVKLSGCHSSAHEWSYNKGVS